VFSVCIKASETEKFAKASQSHNMKLRKEFSRLSFQQYILSTTISHLPENAATTVSPKMLILQNSTPSCPPDFSKKRRRALALELVPPRLPDNFSSSDSCP